MRIALKDADSKASDAAYAGKYDDGGASFIREQVKFYKYGQQGVVPPEWKRYESELDPEYKEYVRLKQKFNSK